MKTEAILRLQAYLDNEVSSADARQIASWIARDTEAKALYEELKATKDLLNPENELAVTLPESHDFYWSKIQRAIDKAEQEPVQQTTHRPWWIRLLAPVAGAAVLGVFVFTSMSLNPAQMSAVHQEESNNENGTITFRSKDRGMTLVWISSGGEMADADVQPAQEDEDP